MSNIDDIVNVQISIESPTSTGESFSGLLLVVPKAAQAGSETMPDCAKIRYASDLTNFGYQSTDAVYDAASAAFAQNPRPEYLFVAARQTTTADGSAKNEAISDTLNRALQTPGWYGFCLVDYTEGTDLREAAIWAGSNSKLFGFTWNGNEIPVDISSYDHAFAIYCQNANTAAAWMAKCFGYTPGAETWALKNLANIESQDISNTKIQAIENEMSNYYRSVAGKAMAAPGKVGSGEWIDVIRFKDYLINEIQVEVFNYLTRNAKVQYNDGGITGVQNVIEGVLSQAQRSGGVDEDRYDDGGNVERGFIVTVPKSADISTSDRKARKLTNVTFTARLAGAIHNTRIKGTLVY